MSNNDLGLVVFDRVREVTRTKFHLAHRTYAHIAGLDRE